MARALDSWRALNAVVDLATEEGFARGGSIGLGFMVGAGFECLGAGTAEAVVGVEVEALVAAGAGSAAAAFRIALLEREFRRDVRTLVARRTSLVKLPEGFSVGGASAGALMV